MLSTTLTRLRCPCGGEFKLLDRKDGAVEAAGPPREVTTGQLKCRACHREFPVLAGVAVIVDDFYSYLLGHASGIGRLVKDEEIPPDFLPDYLSAKSEAELEHINEDLESERVVALYYLTHYLKADRSEWWAPSDPLIDSLIRQHWDRGPFHRIAEWMATQGARSEGAAMIELGCGVGGLYSAVKRHLGPYLGIDGSFASIALARHVTLGVPYAGSLKIPADLLRGELSRNCPVATGEIGAGLADFVVGDLTQAPVPLGIWDYSVALNTIDMLDEPEILPAIQARELKPGGVAIQSSPYTWHPAVAAELRARLPQTGGPLDSARAAEWLYGEAGLKVEWKLDHVPWLFFKHARQIEVYSAHLLAARK